MLFTIQSNDCIAPLVYRMRLTGDTRNIQRPGQFVQIALPGFYLRRPISVCEWRSGEHGVLDIIYKAVGQGTRAMTELAARTELDLLTGLGNGFDMDALEDVRPSQFPLLVGGGVGTPPMLGLCKRLLAMEKQPTVVLGFNTESEIFLEKEFQALGVKTLVCTLDGSRGIEGFVTDGMRERAGKYDYVFACGPEPMLKAVHTLCLSAGIKGQFSFEERMACGFGVCMGCSCKTKYGSKRICKDGPVLRGEEIVW